IHSFFRIPGNNIVNSGSILFNGQLTRLWGFQAGYNNGWYDYKAQENATFLNRIENSAHIDARLQVAPETVAVAGYQFGWDIYTGNGVIGTNGATSNPIKSDARNTISHTFYVGADHNFLPNLVGSVRAGATYYDYYNNTGSSDFGPYAL